MASVLQTFCLVLWAANVLGCVDLISHRHLALSSGGVAWDYSFQGSDWVGSDAAGNAWSCQSGTQQSPLNLPALAQAPRLKAGLATKFQYYAHDKPAMVWRSWNTLQVQNFSSSRIGGVWVPTLGNHITDVLTPEAAAPGAALQTVFMPVRQLHFHTTSEHLMDGFSTTMEMHIVHSSQPGNVGLKNCPAAGCYAVVGAMIKVVDGPDNPDLAAVFAAAPPFNGSVVLPAGTVINLDKILPKNKVYMTYPGSLTTPPCSEGLLWMVMVDPIVISLTQFKAFENAIGSVNCPSLPDTATCAVTSWQTNARMIQPRNGRTVLSTSYSPDGRPAHPEGR